MMAFYELIFRPIELLFDMVFSVLYKLTYSEIISLVGLSVIVNLLTGPLYDRAENYQANERKKHKEMEPYIAKIKDTFSGDEKTFMLAAYYRENNYKPYSFLKGSLSVFIQIPFFVVAYNYIVNCGKLENTVYSSPDSLVGFMGVSINILPILMTRPSKPSSDTSMFEPSPRIKVSRLFSFA